MPDDIRFNIPVHSLLRAEEIAGRSFPKVRRGLDPAKVQAFLESVARDVRLLVEREEELRARLSDAEHRAANPIIDEGTLTAALGQEAASLLQSARSTAAELMAEAELHAAEELAQSRRTAEEMRIEAEAVLQKAQEGARSTLEEASATAAENASRIIEAASADAEKMVNDAKDECRAMVKEAQELRSKVLNDMARRRRTLQIQLEQLRAGRDSLLGSVREVRRTIDQIAEDLHNAEGEARGAAQAAGEQAEAGPGEAEEVEAEAGPGEVEAEDAGEALAEAEEVEAEAGPGEDEAEDAGEALAEAEAGGDDIDGLFARIRAAAQPTTEVSRPRGASRAGVGSGRGSGPVSADESGGRAVDGPEAAASSGVASGAVGSGVVGSGVVAATAMDRSALIKQRDEVIVEIVSGLSRKLKRSLQDEQNVLLDLVRQRAKQPSEAIGLIDSMAGVLGPGDRYRHASEAFLEQARRAGAEYLNVAGGTRGGPHMLRSSPPWMQEHAANLAAAIVGPLRAKLTEDAELDPADEASVADRVSAAYRDWKGQRIELLAADAVIGVFSRASVSTAPPGTRFAWVLDEGGASCPDCEDNSLSGPISLRASRGSNGKRDPRGADGYGEETGDGGAYPTGHLHPPAHAGCRCLLVPEHLLVNEGSGVSG